MGDAADGFETKTGRCIVRDGHLEVLREGPRGKAAAALSVPALLAGHAVIGVALLASATVLLDPTSVTGVIFPFAQALFGAWLLSAAWRSRGASDASSIPLERISGVDEYAPYPGRRGYFEVHFQDDAGRPRRRLVMLPSFMALQEAEARFLEAARYLRAHLPPTALRG